VVTPVSARNAPEQPLMNAVKAMCPVRPTATSGRAAALSPSASPKGLKGRPNIKPSKPSGMNSDRAHQTRQKGEAAASGQGDAAVTVDDQVVKVAVPEGSRFKGHEPFRLQDLVIAITNDSGGVCGGAATPAAPLRLP
jgi:hypothetical protein